MLVLARKLGESIEIGDGIRVSVVQVKGGRVRIAIDAPREVSVRRSELSVAPEAARLGSPNGENAAS